MFSTCLRTALRAAAVHAVAEDTPAGVVADQVVDLLMITLGRSRRSAMILRVKEPQPFEYRFLRPDQIYFSYLHLATSEELTRALMRIGAVFVAYETVQKADGSLPLLKPMSEVAGAMAVQEGAKPCEDNA